MDIGISTAVNTNTDNWDRLTTLVNQGFKRIELYNKITRIRFADVAALADLKNQNGLSYSFHSMVQDFFVLIKLLRMRN